MPNQGRVAPINPVIVRASFGPGWGLPLPLGLVTQTQAKGKTRAQRERDDLAGVGGQTQQHLSTCLSFPPKGRSIFSSQSR